MKTLNNVLGSLVGFRSGVPREVNGDATRPWQVLNETNDFNRLTLLLPLIYILITRVSVQCLLRFYQPWEAKPPLQFLLQPQQLSPFLSEKSGPKGPGIKMRSGCDSLGNFVLNHVK